MAAPAHTVSFQRESISDCYADLRPLLEAHWDHVAIFPDIPLDADWESYLRIEHVGAYRLFTLREYGVLFGYAGFFVRPAMHYKTSLQAVSDVLFADPVTLDGRGFILVDFLKFCDEHLRKEGVQIVSHHNPAGRELGPIFRRLGYEISEIVWTRRLDKP